MKFTIEYGYLDYVQRPSNFFGYLFKFFGKEFMIIQFYLLNSPIETC